MEPLIARTFYRRGVIEEWGRGTLKMAALSTGAGLPPPEIEEGGGCVTVRFRPAQAAVPLAQGETVPADLRIAVLRLLERADGGLTRRELHAGLGSSVSDRKLRRALEKLREGQFVRSTGRGPSARWKRRVREQDH